VTATALPAHLLAAPVLGWLEAGAAGAVLGAGPTAAWVDLGGAVLAVTTREVPLLPNAVALAAPAGALGGLRPGAAVRGAAGRLRLGEAAVVWDALDPPVWDPAVPPARDPAAMRRRAAAVLGALTGSPAGGGSPDPGPPPGPDELVALLGRAGLAVAAEPQAAAATATLLAAVGERDPVAAAAAAGRLVGRGPGLTPEGDDLLAGLAMALAAAGRGGAGGGELLDAVVPADAAARTTALGATLLRLAGAGLAPEPAGRLLDLGPAGERGWAAALRRLRRVGHSSGLAWAAGIAAGLWIVAGGAGGGRVSVGGQAATDAGGRG
jgi:hypothetical protein